MRLWWLTRKDGVRYDEAGGFVVAAPDEAAARALAQQQGGDETRDYRKNWPPDIMPVWTDPARTNCVELRAEDFDEATVILCDFNAG